MPEIAPEKYNFDKLHTTRLYRPGCTKPDLAYSTGHWARQIDHLLAARYTFLPCRYGDGGYLFRGMQTDILSCMVHDCFGHFEGDNEICLVEKVMDIYFLTHEISDAVTVSQLFNNAGDGGIVVLKSSVFNQQLNARRAAVLGIGDGGIVFRYPFVTMPLTGTDIDYIFLHSSNSQLTSMTTALRQKTITIDGCTRRQVELNLAKQFQRLGISASVPVSSNIYPIRD